MALPIIIGNFGNQFLHMADVFMVSRLGTESLAAVGFSASIFSFVMIFFIGLVSGVGVVAAGSKGEVGDVHLGKILKNGLGVSMTISLGIVILLLLLSAYIEIFGQPEVVNLLSRPYLAVVSLSLIPFIVFQNFKQVSEAMGNSKTPMFIVLGGGLLNVLLNYLLIFGKLGFPQMGVLGAAVATLVARILMVVAAYLIVALKKDYKALRESLSGSKKSARSFKKPILKIGVPGGLQYMFEVSLFSFASIFMGWFGVVEQAAHQIALNYAALAFMIPLGLATAAGLRVSYFQGKNDYRSVKSVGNASLGSLLVVMTLLGLVFFGFQELLPKIFSKDTTVLVMASQLLLIVAAFQIFDGLQTVGVAMLRGLGDTKLPTVMLLFCYGFSIALCYYMGFKTDLRHIGVWLGLLVGLALTSLVLNARFYWVLRKKYAQ